MNVSIMSARPTTKIHFYMYRGRWWVSYYRLWDSENNWLYPNHRRNVEAAIAHCKKLNLNLDRGLPDENN
jgi:hypothetical protein